MITFNWLMDWIWKCWKNQKQCRKLNVLIQPEIRFRRMTVIFRYFPNICGYHTCTKSQKPKDSINLIVVVVVVQIEFFFVCNFHFAFFVVVVVDYFQSNEWLLIFLCSIYICQLIIFDKIDCFCCSNFTPPPLFWKFLKWGTLLNWTELMTK